ncbi:hypothetical protein MKX01_034710 [Papaver californicum]|nr:hypothetical protein MKX01_034710 [Papaver californicum]
MSQDAIMWRRHFLSPQSIPKLCTKGCGYFGSESTMNMCSKCYKDSQAPGETCVRRVMDSLARLTIDEIHVDKTKEDSDSCDSIPTDSSVVTRNLCSNCNKRVKLVGGYDCRCGNFYCSKHRCPETHACTFDYKSVGRHMIAISNPLMKQDKLVERI